MEITEVKVFPVRDQKLRAFVSIVLDGSFMVNDIKVINGKDGLFISMPSRRKKNGRFKDIAHPLNNETRQAMEKRILGEYRRVTAEAGEPEEAPDRPVPVPAAAAADKPAPAAAPPAPPAAPPAASPATEETPPAAADPAPTEAAPAEPAPESKAEDKSLEEVAEEHLSDSYWTS